jgi:hypothetical protein
MMEAARSSETLVNFYQTTRRCNPEDSHLCIVTVVDYRIIQWCGIPDREKYKQNFWRNWKSYRLEDLVGPLPLVMYLYRERPVDFIGPTDS